MFDDGGGGADGGDGAVDDGCGSIFVQIFIIILYF